ncbi:MAG: glycosyltransferase, partial [Candidatus Kryptoniota bacterium]
IRDALRELQSDPHKLIALGYQAKVRFDTHFTWQKITEAYRGVYCQIISHKHNILASNKNASNHN